MSAYVVSMMSIHDPETYKKYTDRTPPIVKRHGGKFLTRGEDVTTIEGEPYKNRMVILEFPTKQSVLDWMADPEYQEAMKFRHEASEARILLQEGSVDNFAPNPKLF